jgi:uncharacterized membrane protein YjdF
MFLKKEQWKILYINIIALIFFTFLFLSKENYEFLLYIGVIIFFLFVILLTNKKVNYPNSVLWGLTLWSIMHMSGGGLYLGGKKIYELMLIPIVGEPYNIFKYDQLVHMIGFGVATLIMFYILKPHLQKNIKGWVAISIVIVMAGLGVGAFNEIIEFLATVLVPETGVGGYHNTSLDLVANLIGAGGAMVFLWRTEKKK